jgi:uncharacterized protein (DUF3820 family)
MNVVPFGKYKGRLIEEVLVDDPAYLQWLSGQDWFRTKFVNLYQVIINRGAEPEETPEHNALQVKFLDDEFCMRFVRCLYPGRDLDQLMRDDLEKARMKNLSVAEKRTALKPNAENLKSLDSLREQLSAAVDEIEFRIYSRAFEDKGVDVAFGVAAKSKHHDVRGEWPSIDSWKDDLYPTDMECYLGMFSIEIKPVVGDDYPAVLRQMKANGSTLLFLGLYNGTGATREQFIKTFATAGIRVVFAEDVK